MRLGAATMLVMAIEGANIVETWGKDDYGGISPEPV